MMRKTIALLLAFLMLNTLTACKSITSENAESQSSEVLKDPTVYEEYEEKLPVAEDFAWTVEDGVLIISGHGAMPDYDSETTPDYLSSDSTSVNCNEWDGKEVIIEEGITKIGDYAFNGVRNMISVRLPDSLTHIGKYAFVYCKNIEEFTIPKNVRWIGERAVNNISCLDVDDDNSSFCELDGVLYTKDMTEVVCAFALHTDNYKIPDGVTTIRNFALNDCYLEKITFPDSLKYIGNNAFYYCSRLSSIKLPTNLEFIGSNAFYACKMSSVKIPASVKTISDGAFVGCIGLKEILVDSENKYYTDADGVLFSKDKTKLVCYPAGKSETDFSIPNGVKTLAGYAFNLCLNLTEITIPDSVKTIGIGAFDSCRNLEKVNIPSGVTSIEDRTFAECEKLIFIEIPSGVTKIGAHAFKFCELLESITLPESVESIGERAFFACNSISSINIPPKVTSIEDMTFYGCDSLESLIIPDTVKTIGDEAFGNCSNLSEIKIPKSVNSIGTGAFSSCLVLTRISVDEKSSSYFDIDGVLFERSSMKLLCYPSGNTRNNYTIPDDTKSIASLAFYDCNNIVSVTVNDGLIEINDKAFYNCDSLENIIISRSVTSIDIEAFVICSSFSKITVNEDNSNYCDIDGVLFNKSKTELIHYPAGNSNRSFTAPDSLTSICKYAFERCENLKEITLSSNVSYIGRHAFYDCTSLTDIFYGGTKSRWENLGDSMGLPDETTVHCSDGIFHRHMLY